MNPFSSALTIPMNHPPSDQAPFHSSPLQARALHFLKTLTLRARGSGNKSRDSVAIPTHRFQHAHSSVDLLRKPDISRLIGLRVAGSPSPMDTDDSSQDASASSNSHHSRARRYSALDSLPNALIHATHATHDVPSPFFRDQEGLANKFSVDDAVKLLAPAPLFLRSASSLNAVVQPPQPPVLDPKISLQISLSPEMKLHDEAVQHALNDDTTRPLGVVLSHDPTLTDPSTSSYLGSLPGAQSIPASQELIPETVQEHSPSPSHPTALSQPLFCTTTERGLRLSPSIITRLPMPLLNLPTLRPPLPAPDATSRRQVPLRSIPSLSRHGRSNAEFEADHENATLEDSDEDDDDEGDEELTDFLSIHQSDDDGDEPSVARPSDTHSQEQCVPDVGSLVEIVVSSTASQSHSVSPKFADHTCSEAHGKSTHVVPSSTSLAAYPFSSGTPCSCDVNQHHVLDPDLSMPGAPLESRSSLYRSPSRSMVDLGSTRHVQLGLHSITSREAIKSSAGSTSGHIADNAVESDESDIEVTERLLRRTSMPSFHSISDPPPYPTYNPRPKETCTAPHEGEEREPLPPYSNSLYLIAIMPRKMEFSAPGMQARDRKWRRVVCELEGTTFRVYKCPPGASGVGVLGDWWEKRMGVGDVASPHPPRTQKKEVQIDRPAKLGIYEPSTPVLCPASTGGSASISPARHSRQRCGSQSSVTTTQSTMTSTPRSAKRTSGVSFLSPFRGPSTGEALRRPKPREPEVLAVDMQSSRSSLLQEPTEQATPAQRFPLTPQSPLVTRCTFLPVATGRAQSRNGKVFKPPNSDLLRAYTLQHAESGLGNDYLKRKNVIRLRLEGEQFLLQAPDVPAVVEWIEGLHAGTNIALDIDQRPMPRGPMFPRRRRRRARRTQGEDTPGERTLTSEGHV